MLVLIYLFFLLVLGLPIMVMEFAVGRASQRSIATSFNVLEKEGSKWHIYRYFGMAGNYLLMMFYTTIGGWMLSYFFKMAKGEFQGLDITGVTQTFDTLRSDAPTMIFWMLMVVVLSFLVCSMGLQSGVERINKIMMVVLLLLMVVLAINSCPLPEAGEGLKFYLVPDFNKLVENGISEAVFARYGAGIFYPQSGHRRTGDFRKLHRKREKAYRRSCQYPGAGYHGGFNRWSDYFSGMLCLWYQSGVGTGTGFFTLPNVFNEMPAEDSGALCSFCL